MTPDAAAIRRIGWERESIGSGGRETKQGQVVDELQVVEIDGAVENGETH